MRRWIWAVGRAAMSAGCKAKHEAGSGKERLEKFQAAAKAKDGETCWKMRSKDTQKQKGEKGKMMREMLKDVRLGEIAPPGFGGVWLLPDAPSVVSLAFEAHDATAYVLKCDLGGRRLEVTVKP